MGITLTSKAINSTYDSLLKLSDNDQLTGAFKVITDGLGNDTGISINNANQVNIAGQLVVNSSITANSFVKSGGLSGQFLKADGSVDSNTYQSVHQKGLANGYPPLDSGAKIPELYLPDSIVGQLEYQGTWNASTNTPTLPSASTVKGHYYVTSAAGTYNTIEYAVGDWVISNGTSWEKVDNTDAVTTVFGRLGAIVADENDYSNFYHPLNGNLAANASTATTLQTARFINGTSFNGSANITTSIWGTARNITIGDTEKSLNGSTNVTWTRAELGITKVNIDALNIDADTLDGLQSSFAPTANTVPIRNANGDISAREIVLSSAISAQTPTVLVSMYPTTNQLVRTTPAAVAASMGAWTSSNDGSGSGLDADLLDGLQGSQFLRSDTSDTMSGTLNITGSLAIGKTTSPATTLDINGGILANGNIATSAGNISANYNISAGGNILAGGNVGIGTTSPTAKLHLYVNSANDDTFHIYNGSVRTHLLGSESSNGVIYMRSSANSNTIRINASGDSYFNGGNVGIGTTSPDVPLEVVSASPTNGIVADFVNSTNAGGTTAAIKLSNADSEACDVVLGANRVGANFGSDFFISLSDSVDGSNQERFRITEAGNVGIGTTSPSSTLNIVHTDPIPFRIARSTAGQTAIRLTNGSANNVDLTNDGSNNFSIANAGAERMRIDSSGRVGIGTTSPTNQLHVHTEVDNAYAIRIEGSTNNAAGVWTGLGIGGEGNNTKSALLFEDIGDSYSRGKLHLCVNNELNQNIATPADAKLTISNNGNVGIGTATPDYLLDISGGSGVGARILTNGFTNLDLVSNRTGGNLGGIRWKQDIDPSQTSEFLGLHGGGFDWKTGDGSAAPAIKMSMLPNGNVGIGTTTPRTKLTVRGASSDGGGVLTLENSTTATGSADYVGKIQFYGTDSGIGASGVRASIDANIQGYNGETDLVFSTAPASGANTEAMRIDQNGNVGIGTTTPNSGYKLDISGNLKASGNIVGGNFYNAGANYVFGLSTTLGEYINRTGNDIIVYAGGSARLTVDGDGGNIGIGTTTPDTLLQATNTANGTDYISYEIGNSAVNASNKGGFAIYELGNKKATLEYYRDSSGRFEIASQGAGNPLSLSTTALGDTTPTERIRIDSSGNVGIGQSTMLFTAAGRATLTMGGSTSAVIGFGNAGTDWGSIFSSSTNTSLSSSSGYLNFNTSGSERVRIDSSGRVGIGTTSPSARLDIAYLPGAAWMKLTNASEPAFNLTTFNNGTGNGDAIYAFKHGLYYDGTENAAVTFYRGGSSVGGFLTFTTNNGSERMRIDSSGRVGIGTNSPDSGSLLDVNGDIKLAAGAKIKFNDDRYFSPENNIDGAEISANGIFKIKTGATPVERFRIDSSGRVGIGTTSPGAPLQVNGTISSGHTVLFTRNLSAASTDNALFKIDNINSGDDQPAAQIGQRGTGDILQLIDGHITKVFVVKDGGDVGIGTDNPSKKLTVNSGTVNVGVKVISTDAGSTISFQDNTTNGDNVQVGAVGDDMYFTSGGGERMRITSSGVVQVKNSDSPTLQIYNTDTFVAVGQSLGKLDFYSTDGAKVSSYIEAEYTSGQGDSELIFATSVSAGAATERMRITSSGNVGIGTTSPAAKLEVNGDTSLRANYKLYFGQSSTALGSWTTRMYANGSEHRFNANSFVFNNEGYGSTEYMRITSAGNVGIGTTSPSEKLDVAGNIKLGVAGTQNYITFHGTTGDIGNTTYIGERVYAGTERSELILYKGNDGQSDTVGRDRIRLIGANLCFDVYGIAQSYPSDLNGVGALPTTRAMTIDHTGSVGIGDSTPSYKLDVNGTIRATGDIIAYSDARVKENVNTIENALDKVIQLRGVEYNKIGDDKQSIGVIAQEIEKVLPQVVQEDDEGMKSVAYGNIVGVLIEAIKEQQQQIDELKKRLDGCSK